MVSVQSRPQTNKRVNPSKLSSGLKIIGQCPTILRARVIGPCPQNINITLCIVISITYHSMYTYLKIKIARRRVDSSRLRLYICISRAPRAQSHNTFIEKFRCFSSLIPRKDQLFSFPPNSLSYLCRCSEMTPIILHQLLKGYHRS